MRVILSNAPVRVIHKAVVEKSAFGRKRYVEAGEIIFCLCAKLAMPVTMARVKLADGFIGDIKREHLKPLSALELLGIMSDDSFDKDYFEDDDASV